MHTMTSRAVGRKGRRATSARRSPRNDTRRPPLRDIPGRGRVAITGPGAVEFLRALENGGEL